MLLIEHEMDVVMRLADEITVLNLGQLLARGTATEIQSNQEVVEAYLGVATTAPPGTPQPAATSKPLLEVRDLTVRYGDIEAVRSADLTVGAGEFRQPAGQQPAPARARRSRR